MLITGASATVSDLTGMSTYAACVLMCVSHSCHGLTQDSPLTVVLYVVVGGMRATLLADYTHTTALFIMCVCCAHECAHARSIMFFLSASANLVAH